jgi:hypothetical protein
MHILSSIGLPHRLMIAGAVLVATGFFGLAFTRNRDAVTSEPPPARPQMPPLPKLLDSSTRKSNLTEQTVVGPPANPPS